MTTISNEVIRAGAPIGAARAAMVLVHGRGASAEGMLGLADAFGAQDIAYVAPQARLGSWYPNSFMAPISQNEPYLSDALKTLSGVVGDLERQGVSSDRIVLLGFSQGACLALEFAARNARRYGGVVGLSGGLIGRKGRRGTTLVLSRTRPCFSDAATSISTFRLRGCMNRPRC